MHSVQTPGATARPPSRSITTARILTLTAELAAIAGTPYVLAALDDDEQIDVFGTWLETATGYDVPEPLGCFSWNQLGEVRDLYDLATVGTLRPDPQKLARIGGEVAPW